MQALKLVQDLIDGYAVNKDSALWSISTWCYMLGKDEVASLIEVTSGGSSNTGGKSTSRDMPQYRDEYDFQGVYRAGKDFPSGTIQIILNGKWEEGYCSAYISKKPNADWRKTKEATGEFRDQAYLDVNDGEYLYVRGWNYFKWKPTFGYRIVSIE